MSRLTELTKRPHTRLANIKASGKMARRPERAKAPSPPASPVTNLSLTKLNQLVRPLEKSYRGSVRSPV